MRAFLVDEGNYAIGDCVVVALDFNDALAGWSEWAARDEDEEQIPPNGFQPGGVENLGGERILFTRRVLELLKAPDAAWGQTGRGVFWDVCGAEPEPEPEQAPPPAPTPAAPSTLSFQEIRARNKFGRIRELVIAGARDRSALGRHLADAVLSFERYAHDHGIDLEAAIRGQLQAHEAAAEAKANGLNGRARR